MNLHEYQSKEILSKYGALILRKEPEYFWLMLHLPQVVLSKYMWMVTTESY